jgi:hypothetical protein
MKTKPIVTKGAAQSATLAAGGHVKMGGGSLASCLSYIQAGTLRPLALTSKERWPQVPNTPTTAELGYPTIKTQQWTGISGPPKFQRLWMYGIGRCRKWSRSGSDLGKSIGTKKITSILEVGLSGKRKLKILWGMK